MEVILVRHAESLFNAHKPKITHMDTWLTDLGVEQAEDCAFFLQNQFGNMSDWQGFVSPYLRTLQTARIIHEETRVPFEIDWKLREFGSKEFSGFAEMPFHVRNRSDDPDLGVFFSEDVDPDKDGWLHFEETKEDLLARCVQFVDSLPEGKNFIVSHGATILALHSVLMGNRLTVPEWDRSILNTTITWHKDGQCKWFARFVNKCADPREKWFGKPWDYTKSSNL